MTIINQLPPLVGRVSSQVTANHVYVSNRDPHQAVAVAQHPRLALQDRVKRKLTTPSLV